MHLHYWCDTVASKDLTDFSMIMFIKSKGRVVTLTDTEDETVDELPWKEFLIISMVIYPFRFLKWEN